MKRNIIYHAGPTNSGKTYNALERLRNAKSGMYCGPLKLLATEVFDKFNAEVFFISVHFTLLCLINTFVSSSART